MNLRNFKAVLATGAVAIAVLAAAPAFSGGNSAAYKMEGAWVARCVEVPLQWSWDYVPDSSGRRATANAHFDVGPVISDLGFGVATKDSHILIEAEMTGPDTLVFSAVWYGLKEPSTILPGVLTADIVYIGVDKGVLTFVAPGKALGVHHIEYYLPSQDADGDGFPDPGEDPVLPMEELHSVNTRLPGP